MTSLAMPHLKAEQVELEQVASISILVTWEIFSEISLADAEVLPAQEAVP